MGKGQRIGISEAWGMWRAGKLPIPSEQLPTGTVIIHPPKAPTIESVALYARVLSADQKALLERQLGRLAEYASRERLMVIRSVSEIGSGLNGHRAKIMRLLSALPCNPSYRAPRPIGAIRFGGHRSGTRGLRDQARYRRRDRDDGRSRRGQPAGLRGLPTIGRSPNGIDNTKAGERPSEAALRRKLNSIKDDQFAWMREVTKNAPQQTIKNLGTPFKNYFADLKKPKRQRQFHYPQFKKRGKHGSFRADNGSDKDHRNAVEVAQKCIKLPVIGWVKMRESLRFAGQIKSAVVSRIADRWFVSLTVEVEHTPPLRENQAVVGVDLGVKALANLQ